MQDQNLQVIEAFENAIRNKDWSQFENLLGESVVLHAPDSPEPRRGRRAVREFYKGFAKAFPDMNPTAARRFAQGEWVLGEYLITGTHNGPLAGGGQTIPATHKKVSIPNATVHRVQGGKVTEVHEYFDQLGLLAQLGLTPPSG